VASASAQVNAHPQHAAVVPVHRAWHPAGLAATLQQRAPVDRQGALDGGGTDGAGRQAEQAERRGVGADDPAVFRHGQQAFGHGAQALGLAVQVQLQPAAVAGLEQLVLDHARRRADQRERVAVVVAVVAGDVEHAEQLAARVGDGCGGTGQERVAFEEVLGTVHDDRRAGRQRRADRVGAAPLLVPDRAGAQGHACRLVGHGAVAQRVQQHALRVGQDDHAVGVADLVEQELHHRPRMRDERMPVLQRPRELRAGGMRRPRRAPVGRQAEAAAAQPAGLQARVDQATGEFAGLLKLAACFAQARGGRAVGECGCGHALVSVRRSLFGLCGIGFACAWAQA
jgi:hypothetical protein